MTLQEKFENVALTYDTALNITKENVQIAEEFAIGFAEWFDDLNENYCKDYTIKELLEIYKKTL